MSGPRPKYAIMLTPEQAVRLQQVRTCYMAPFAIVQRAQIVVYAVRHPEWTNTTIAPRLGCSVTTVKRWRRWWQTTESLREAARAGRGRTFTPRQRARVRALACSAPWQYDKPWRRWAGEKLARGAVAQQIVESIAPSTMRTWLRQDKIKPWRYHSWPHATDPQFGEKAVPVLDLYEQALPLSAHGELTVWADEQTSSQARPRVTPTKAAAPGNVGQVAARYKRLGTVQLFCALVVARGLTFAQTRGTKKFAAFKAFLTDLWQRALCAGLTVLHLILENGPTPAPKHLAPWLAS